MPIRIHSERSSDIAAIEAVTIAAFQNADHSSHTEQFIIRALRQAGQLSVSLVAEDEGLIIGHVAASPVAISDGTANWYGLGPISVTPERQGQGIGTQLISHVLSDLRELGAAGCVLLGDPGYYSRFGFTVEPSLILPDVPSEYFQAVSFKSSMPSGTVTYHDAFSAEG